MDTAVAPARERANRRGGAEEAVRGEVMVRRLERRTSEGSSDRRRGRRRREKASPRSSEKRGGR